MAMKRFVAPDMRRALDMVRQQLGPDAIILSSQRTAQGVEIITSTELDYTTRGAQQSEEFRSKFDEEIDQPLASDAAWQSHQGVDAAINQYRSEAAIKLDRSRSEQLAAEIDAARERMLAAKQGQNPHRARAEAPAANIAADTHTRANVDSASSGSTAAPQNRQASIADIGNQKVADEKLAGVDRQMAGLREQVAKMEAAHRKQHQDEAYMSALRDEIADMRMLLEQQMWRMKDSSTEVSAAGSPILDSLKSHLTALGLPNELVKKLALTAKPGQRLNSAWRSALAHLTKQIQIDSSDPINDGGTFAFVGPTGVGKTTTIAKLAARYVLKHGLGKVALITTDTYRVGAHDQLRSLGRILNVPVRVVDKERALPSVIASLKDYPLILIDTAGFRHGDPLLREQERLLASCPGLQRVLVLAANSQRQTLKASAHAFKSQKLRGCIITKIDETGSLGELLGVLAQQRIGVLYSADGQNIPNDLSVGSAANLVAKAVNLMKLQREADKTIAATP